MPRQFAAVAILVLLFVSSSAWARTWSDNTGNTVEARFVRVHNGQVVLLRPGNRILTVPVGDLSAEDIEYLRKELEKNGQAHLLPATRPPLGPGADDGNIGGTVGEDRPRAPEIQRMWTDTEGKKIRASYVRTDGENVVLLMDGTEYKVPLSRLSRIDQTYVRAKSMMNQLPSAPRGPSRMPGGMPGPPTGIAGRPAGVGSPQYPGGYGDSSGGRQSRADAYSSQMQMAGSSTRSSDYGTGSGGMVGSSSRYSPDDSDDGYGYSGDTGTGYGSDDDSGAEDDSYESEYGSDSSGEYDDYEESYASDMSSPPSGSGSRDRAGSGNSAPDYASASSAPSYAPPSSRPGRMPGPHFPDPPSIPQSSMPSMPVMEEVGECSNCGKEVSGEFGAGDNCPHCGVFFEYEEDDYGRKEYAEEGSGPSNFRVTGGGIRGVVKLLAFLGAGFAAFCGWAIRKAFTS